MDDKGVLSPRHFFQLLVTSGVRIISLFCDYLQLSGEQLCGCRSNVMLVAWFGVGSS